VFSPAALTVFLQVLRGDVARLFAPSSGGDRPFDYNATLLLHNNGRRVVVRVFKVAAGRETLLGEGWGEICEDFNLTQGDVAVFRKAALQDDRTFIACFLDANGNPCPSSFDALDDPPSSPEFQGSFARPRPTQTPATSRSKNLSFSFADLLRHCYMMMQLTRIGCGHKEPTRRAGAGRLPRAGGGGRALQGGDMTIKGSDGSGCGVWSSGRQRRALHGDQAVCEGRALHGGALRTLTASTYFWLLVYR